MRKTAANARLRSLWSYGPYCAVAHDDLLDARARAGELDQKTRYAAHNVVIQQELASKSQTRLTKIYEARSCFAFYF